LKACFNPAHTRRWYCSFPSAGRSSSHTPVLLWSCRLQFLCAHYAVILLIC